MACQGPVRGPVLLQEQKTSGPIRARGPVKDPAGSRHGSSWARICVQKWHCGYEKRPRAAGPINTPIGKYAYTVLKITKIIKNLFSPCVDVYSLYTCNFWLYYVPSKIRTKMSFWLLLLLQQQFTLLFPSQHNDTPSVRCLSILSLTNYR
jgi:hypothetical protein